MSQGLDHVAVAFQERRKRYIRFLVLVALPFVLIGFTLPYIADNFIGPINENFFSLMLSLVGILMSGVGIVVVTKKTYNNYRCPKCGQVPISKDAWVGSSGVGASWLVDLNPTTCAKCGVALK